MIQNCRARLARGCLDRTEFGVDRPYAWAKHTIDTELLRSKTHCQQWVLQHIQFLVLRTAYAGLSLTCRAMGREKSVLCRT